MDRQERRIATLIFYISTFGFTGGVLLASLVQITNAMYLVIGVSFLVCVICSIFFPRSIFLGVFLLCAVLGIVRFVVSRPNESVLADSVGKTVQIEGIIAEPVRSEQTQQFVIETRGIGILVSTEAYPELTYGDRVEVSGLLERPKNFLTDTGREFDYVSYLYKDAILYRMSQARVRILAHGQGNHIVSILITCKDALLHNFQRQYVKSESELLAGIILGVKSGISDSFRTDLIDTSTIHIIALSGFNVSIVARWLSSFTRNVLSFGRVSSASMGIIGIILFVLMTGIQSSAIRAAMMACIAIFARTYGYSYNAARALVFAAVGMLIWNPRYLVFDVSFQLSFLATCGLLFLTPLFEQLFIRVPQKWGMREMLSVTLGAQTAVLPLIVYRSGVLSLIALPANVAVLPAIPIVMATGTLAGFLGFYSFLFAAPLVFVSHVLLHYIQKTITFAAQIPFAAITIAHYPLWLCLVSYGAIIFFVWRKRGIF